MPRSPVPRGGSSSHDAGEFSVRVSGEPDDPVWDEFVERAPGGTYSQLSGWGRARELIGWRSTRAVVSQDGLVVAGVQLAVRTLPTGEIGFVVGGPVLGDDRPGLTPLVLDEMMALAKASRVLYLAVRPARGCDRLGDELTAVGFRPSLLDSLDIYHPATILVDLQPEVDALYAELSPSLRRNLKYAQKGGVTVRLGSATDLPIFDRFKDAHSARLGYKRRPPEYFAALWDALAARDHIRLFVAEHGGQPIATALYVAFGDTYYSLERLWSGEHPEARANEQLEWEILKHAKAEGFRYFDMGGIEAPVALAAQAGEQIPSDPRFGPSLFKLRWGGQVFWDPPFFDYICDPALRLAYRCTPQRLVRSELAEKVAKRLKNEGS